ncbi:MAG: prolipoprotein diacylglyceryl transferase [Clostridia bacterium]|nr:prolipoprotein diacylglyceryl transferase [Clostridia bacterium]
MNGNYWLCIAATALISFGWLAFRLGKRGMKPWSAVLGLPLSALLGAALGKLFYVGLLFQRVWPRFGAEALWRLKAAEFSFFGGGVGVVLAIVLTAKCTGQKVKPFLSAFAPCGALLAAGFRAAEFFQGMLGAGSYMESSAFTRFPFAVANQWGEWHLAVFSLEALAALIIALVFALGKREDSVPGLHLERTVFYLCVTQIFFESLRNQCMRWGFVRIEQVLCGVTVVGLIVYGCFKAKGIAGFKRFWPACCSLLCVALIVLVEFGLDKFNFSTVFWYGVMIAVLCGFSALECVCVKRRLGEKWGHVGGSPPPNP